MWELPHNPKKSFLILAVIFYGLHQNHVVDVVKNKQNLMKNLHKPL